MNEDGGGIDLFNTSPLKIIIGGLLTIIIIFTSLVQIDVLEAQDYLTNKHLKSWRLDEGEGFTVLYTHSVELTPVSELYIIKDGEIVLVETYFKSYGAGLPSSTPYKFEIREDDFRIYEINKIMDNLIYRTGAVRANHTLLIGDKEFNFLDFSKPREGVKFQTNRLSLLRYFIRRFYYER